MRFMARSSGPGGLLRLEAIEGVIDHFEIKIGDTVVMPFGGKMA